MAEHLSSVLSKEIDSLATSASVEESKELANELLKVRTQVILRKSLIDYESEEIVKRRMEMRASYLAVVLSGIALIVSIIAFATSHGS